MNNKKYFNVVSLLIIGPFIITAIIWLKWRFDELQMQQNAETMIRTIDSIKNETGFYPDNLIYLESDSGVGPFYEKKNDSTYTVYFCLGFDEYYIYDSESNCRTSLLQQTAVACCMEWIYRCPCYRIGAV